MTKCEEFIGTCNNQELDLEMNVRQLKLFDQTPIRLEKDIQFHIVYNYLKWTSHLFYLLLIAQFLNIISK